MAYVIKDTYCLGSHRIFTTFMCLRVSGKTHTYMHIYCSCYFGTSHKGCNTWVPCGGFNFIVYTDISWN